MEVSRSFFRRPLERMAVSIRETGANAARTLQVTIQKGIRGNPERD